MEALSRLQENIEQWKKDHQALKSQNSDLKSQLAVEAEAQTLKDSLVIEIEAKTQECDALKESVASLQSELEEKDTEIEKIIAQVESLLA